MVYPNFASCLYNSNEYYTTKTFNEIPGAWERFVTLDHGLRNPTAVYFNAIDPDTGTVVTYDEYYVAGALVPQHALSLKPKIEAIPAGKLRFMVADPSIRNKTDPINGKSVQSIYQEYSLYFTEGNNNIDMGVLKVNSYINRGKWIIFKDKCPNLAKEGIRYKWPEQSMDDKKNPDEKPVKKDDHAMDSTRYGFSRLPDDPEMLKTIAMEPPRRYNSHEYEDDELEEYDGRDYMSYL